MYYEPLRRGFAEFIGAFTLIFIGAGATLTFTKLFAAAFAQGAADTATGLGLVWIAQLTGAVLAALLLKWFYPERIRNLGHLGVPALGAGVSQWQGFVIEIVL